MAQHTEKGLKAQLKAGAGNMDLPSIPGLTATLNVDSYPIGWGAGSIGLVLTAGFAGALIGDFRFKPRGAAPITGGLNEKKYYRHISLIWVLCLGLAFACGGVKALIRGGREPPIASQSRRAPGNARVSRSQPGSLGAH